MGVGPIPAPGGGGGGGGGGATDADITAAVTAHAADTTDIHGIADTSALLAAADIGVTVQGYSAVLAATTASFTTADESKLDGIEAGADVTDAANVAAAGAVMGTLVDAKGDLLVATAADTVARLPVGATNGHVLTVDSAEAGGVKWAAASGGGGGASLPQAPLTFNDNSTPYTGVPGVALGPRGGALSVPANEYRASLMVVQADITISEARISVEGAGTAGTNCRMAIYEQDTADGKLGALVADLGTVSIASTGQKRLTGLSVSVPAGVYCVRAHNESTASLTYFAGYCPWWSAAPLGNNNNPLAMFGGGLTYAAAEDPGNKAATEWGDVTGTSMYVLVQFVWSVD